MELIVLVPVLGAAALMGIGGIYLLARRASKREPYASILRLRTRQKISLLRRLMTDPRVPLPVKVIPVLLAIYLVSPIDLIPDFIPVIGILDDVAIVFGALALVIRLTPSGLIEDLIAQIVEPRPDPVDEKTQETARLPGSLDRSLDP